MTIHSISEFRRAQAYVADLTKMVQILDITEASLLNYVKYKAIYQILTTINDYKPILKIALEENKIIVLTKGEQRR